MSTRRPLVLIVVAAGLALAIVLAALAGAGLFAADHLAPITGPSTDPGELWAVPPIETSAIAVAAVLYALAVRRLGGVSGRRRLSFAAGLLIILAAVVSPLTGMAQQGLLTAHMLQHTLIGAVAPLLLLLGLPRDFATRLVGPVAMRRLQRLQHPAVAYPVWAVSTVLWLVPAVHHEVLHNSAIWIVQQFSFALFGLLLWAPVVESIPAPAWFSTGWKGGYMNGVWTLGLFIANVYWFSGTAFYESHAAAADAWGFEALEDQANAGTVMMILHCLLAFGAITYLFFRQAREGELSQRLIEAGLEPARVSAAIRAGGGEALARTHGIPVRTRPGID
ncbi:cytochrome c oxidase assembly protein [Miltoncostaea marina]|uniref:cytochrome c oxidase assembly protein n=1 Tax=Miltoncostaea marina TaxID=2843215 RepID=UPI001C3C30B9|nr:cytochrome c oxidase assembly protein [Miltoncostaea marina]